MARAIMRDPRVRGVEWRDLVPVSALERVAELALPLPWLAGSLVLAAAGWWWAALPLSFVFFLTGLRVSHNAQHTALGLSRRATDLVMGVLSVVMLGSMHAVQVNHLRHHSHCLDEDDVESISARMPVWRVAAFGPVFPFVLHVFGWRHGNARQRRWIAGELAAIVAMLALVLGFVVLPVAMPSSQAAAVGAGVGWPFGEGVGAALAYHLLAMGVGQCMTAFFAVWLVHHHCDVEHHIARTLRGRWRNRLTFHMFLHIEHHLYPRVPTCHLATLAQRLDQAAPELRERRVF